MILHGAEQLLHLCKLVECFDPQPVPPRQLAVHLQYKVLELFIHLLIESQLNRLLFGISVRLVFDLSGCILVDLILKVAHGLFVFFKLV